MTPKLKFAEGEKVLCFHGPLIYEAKALKSTITKDKQVKYYIHYAGWNKNWDEWVPENRVLKYNEANVQRQKEVSKQHSSSAGRNKKATPKGKKSDVAAVGGGNAGSVTPKDDSRASSPSKETLTPLAAPSTSSRGRSKSYAASVAAASTGSTTSVTSTSTPTVPTSSTTNTTTSNCSTPIPASTNDSSKDDPQKRKRGRFDLTVESEEQFFTKVEVKIKIPEELKPCLVDDWDAVTFQHKLLDLPAKITVQDIFDAYIAFKKASKSTNPSKEVAITDVTNGLSEYFNVLLGSQLLYKFERQQYAELLRHHPNVPMSKLYGAFHLLRLFVKIGPVLSFTSMDEKSIATMQSYLHDFLKFLAKNSSTYFSMSNFINVSPEYHRTSQYV